ncbi:MAG: glycosyltransferase family 2 protein, partial [Deltaproteobacteria bacterium]
ADPLGEGRADVAEMTAFDRDGFDTRRSTLAREYHNLLAESGVEVSNFLKHLAGVQEAPASHVGEGPRRGPECSGCRAGVILRRPETAGQISQKQSHEERVMSERLNVSIVISSYNYARFLGEAIDSALRQTWPHVEVIVVDDGSTDDSPGVIAKYRNRIIPVVKKNGGMASTQNAGFAASRGDIVVFLDADDALLPTAIEQAVECFTDPSVVRVQWNMWEIDAHGRRTGGQVPGRSLKRGNLRDLLVSEGPDACVGPPTSGNAWSRLFLNQVLPIPEAMFRQHSDTFLMTLAPLYGTIEAVAEPLGLYRVHGGNDYACKPVDEKNRRNLEMYDLRCQLLGRHLRQMGIEADSQVWKQGTGYQWMSRCHAASEALKQLVPEGASYILVDDQNWSDRAGRGEVIGGRSAIPFLERDGQYWGQPADDAIAVRELERLRGSGAACIAFAWPCFWWLEHYRGLQQHLREHYPCVLSDNDLIVFELGSQR